MLINELNRLGNEAWIDISDTFWGKTAYTGAASVNDTKYEANNAENTKIVLDASINRVCTTDEFTGNQNIPRESFRQFLNKKPERFRFIVAFDFMGESVDYTAPILFLNDDFVSFKFTINLTTGQHDLTQVHQFGARVYKTNLIVKDTLNVADCNM